MGIQLLVVFIIFLHVFLCIHFYSLSASLCGQFGVANQLMLWTVWHHGQVGAPDMLVPRMKVLRTSWCYGQGGVANKVVLSTCWCCRQVAFANELLSRKSCCCHELLSRTSWCCHKLLLWRVVAADNHLPLLTPWKIMVSGPCRALRSNISLEYAKEILQSALFNYNRAKCIPSIAAGWWLHLFFWL